MGSLVHSSSPPSPLVSVPVQLSFWAITGCPRNTIGPAYWLKAKINVRVAALILSVIFALLHDNGFANGAVGWLAFSERFLLGLAASAFAVKYRSLLPSLVMHGTLNAIVCIASVLNID